VVVTDQAVIARRFEEEPAKQRIPSVGGMQVTIAAEEGELADTPGAIERGEGVDNAGPMLGSDPADQPVELLPDLNAAGQVHGVGVIWLQHDDLSVGCRLAAQIGRQIDASLARLRTDHVDLYQAHRFDPDVPIEETIEAFQQVVASGKARYLGFSEWTAEQVQAAIDLAGPELFVSSQPQYSMLWRAREVELFPLCAANGVSQIVWSPLAQGVLTGKYRPGQAPPPDSRAANSDMNVAMDRLLDDAVLEAVDRLRPVADEAGLSMAELALAWVLHRPELASAIVGASRPEQVHANAKASGMRLTPDTLAAIEEALGDTPVKEPTLAPLARPGVTHREA
jgi:aryl-alcohol dehydrogenase-like predicted oxidoreductase